MIKTRLTSRNGLGYLVLSKIRRLATLSIVSLIGLIIYAVGLRFGLSDDFLVVGVIVACLVMYAGGTYLEQRVFSLHTSINLYLTILVPLIGVMAAIVLHLAQYTSPTTLSYWIQVALFPIAVLSLMLVGNLIILRWVLLQPVSAYARSGIRRLPLLIFVIGSPLVAASGVALAQANAGFFRPPTPTTTGTSLAPTPTLTPAPYPLPTCRYVLNEWPCVDTVRDTAPRDGLYSMARRNYHIEGVMDPFYANAICEVNRAFLDAQFYTHLTLEQRALWAHNPCNYVVPGNLIIIPIPPTPPPP